MLIELSIIGRKEWKLALKFQGWPSVIQRKPTRKRLQNRYSRAPNTMELQNSSQLKIREA